MHKFIFHEQASYELQDAIKYYGNISSNLLSKFKRKIKQSLQIITKNPFTFQIIRNEMRACFIKKFPYRIIYTIKGDNTVVIISIFHTSRNPNVWKTRDY